MIPSITFLTWLIRLRIHLKRVSVFQTSRIWWHWWYLFPNWGLLYWIPFYFVHPDIFMHYLEKKNVSVYKFFRRFRYVDDNFVLVSSNTNVSNLLYLVNKTDHIKILYNFSKHKKLFTIMPSKNPLKFLFLLVLSPIILLNRK